MIRAAVLLALTLCLPALAGERLVLDRPASGAIEWRQGNRASYTVDVPEDAVALIVKIESSPVDLDLHARLGEPMDEDHADAEHSAETNLYEDELRIFRLGDPALETGRYHVDVVYALGTPPVAGKRRLERIPFTLRASVIRTRVDALLAPDARYTGRTTPEEGHFRTFVIDVPAGVEAMRIDLDEVDSDLDIALRRGRQIVALADADAEAATALGRESLLLDRHSTPPLAPGRWFLNVFDPVQDGTVSFAAHLRFARHPPAPLLAIPSIPPHADPLERAIHATVQLIGPDGLGSGTLLSPDGLILTNRHVVETMDGGIVTDGDLVVGITLDERRPSVELFRARVLRSDERLDLSLVEITSGLYGQPLPASYRFPYLELGQPARLKAGSRVHVVGFPEIGGTGSRVSVTLTQGIVSGFEASDIGTVIKTDANISPGNSGGAALDDDYQLIGVPTGVVPAIEGNEQLGYVYPIDVLPAQWRALIAKRRQDAAGSGQPPG